MLLQRRRRPTDRDVALHRARHVDLLLGGLVVLLEAAPDVLGLVEDVHELHDEPVPLLLERVVPALGQLDAVLDRHEVLPRRFHVLRHLLAWGYRRRRYNGLYLPHDSARDPLASREKPDPSTSTDANRRSPNPGPACSDASEVNT
jgi:hypothetical protein